MIRIRSPFWILVVRRISSRLQMHRLEIENKVVQWHCACHPTPSAVTYARLGLPGIDSRQSVP